MPFDVSWHTNNQIILIKLIGDVTEEELQLITDKSFDMVQASTMKVHALVDQRDMQSAPRGLKTMTDFIKSNKHPNQGITVLVAPNMNALTKFIVSTMFQVLRLEYRLATNMEDALTIIRKVDLTIAP